MQKRWDIVAVVGSLRRDSINGRLVRALASNAPSSMEIHTVAIGDLPHYNQDIEDSPPAAWLTFRERILRADAVLFVTPEYNRSVPGALKNAIDVGSRPYGRSVWAGKPAAVLTASPGAMGGFGANHHLRQMLVFLDMPTLQQPEAYIGGADKLVDDSGAFVTASGKNFLLSFLAAFEGWISRLAQPPKP